MDFQSIIAPARRYPAIIGAADIKRQPEDFEVEELPIYQPCGSGEHLFLWLQKTDVSAGELVRRVSRMLKIDSRDVGVAGKKDRRAVTRQFVSVPYRCKDRVCSSRDGSVRILSAVAHGNKLRTGHVSGNHFRIVLRATDAERFSETDLACVQQRLVELSQNGFPNYFGPQRFGHGGNSIRDGLALIRRDLPSPRWKRHQQRMMKKLVASAVQSAVFNQVVSQRILSDNASTPQPGDVVCRRDGIRPFLFDERGDTDATGLVPMGPMPGAKMQAATGPILDAERSVLDSLEIVFEDFTNLPKLTPGTRRKMIEFPTQASAALQPDGSIVTDFKLPSGSFATVLLAEICNSVAG